MERLPAHIEQVLAWQRRDGVSFSRERGRGITVIRWRPGDPNALAQQIIGNVGDEEMPLILDGQKFMIRRVP
jgi:hypothetical protein